MKIRMKSICSGPDGVLHDGELYPVGNDEDMVSEQEAETLVKGGYAEYADIPVPKGFVSEKETAVVTPPEVAAKGKSVSAEKSVAAGPWGAK